MQEAYKNRGLGMSLEVFSISAFQPFILPIIAIMQTKTVYIRLDFRLWRWRPHEFRKVMQCVVCLIVP